MKAQNIVPILMILTLGVWFSVGVSAQEKTADTIAQQPVSKAELTEGVIRKIDRENKKITIKHGEIKNLEMPGMTMVFQVKDPGMLDLVQPGDHVKFRAEKTGGSFVVTDIQVNK